MSTKKPKELPPIGWREWVTLPDLQVSAIKAKVDTGARSSALHAFEVELFRRRGSRMVRFKIHPIQRRIEPTIEAEAEVVDERHIRNSGGNVELRPVIETRVELLGQVWPIELTLTNRDAMGFRMLLGRQAVRGKFLVDPSTSFKSGRKGPKRQPSRKKKPSAKPSGKRKRTDARNRRKSS